MGLISSILNLGTFEVPLSDLRKGSSTLSAAEADAILSQEHSFLQRIYLWYITSFTHYHELEKAEHAETTLLRVAPSKWLKKFLFIGVGSILALMILLQLFGGQDRESTLLLMRGTIIAPIVLFGIPSFLGWLYFQFCVGKLKEH